MFSGVINVTVETHGIGDSQLISVSNQAVMPPSTADDVQVQIRDPGSQHRDGVKCVLDLLMRHQPGQHHSPRSG